MLSIIAYAGLTYVKAALVFNRLLKVFCICTFSLNPASCSLCPWPQRAASVSACHSERSEQNFYGQNLSDWLKMQLPGDPKKKLHELDHN